MIRIRLREAAKKMGINASEVARQSGVNRNTVNALMKGSVSDVRLSTLIQLCSALELKLSDLVVETHNLDKMNIRIDEKRARYRQEGEIVPFTCWPVALAAGSYRFDVDGRQIGFRTLDLYFKGDYGYMYWDLNALAELAGSFYRKYSDREAFQELYSRYRHFSSELESIFLEAQEVSNMKPEWWIDELFVRLRAVYISFWENSLFIDAFDVGVDQQLIGVIAKRHDLSTKEVEILTTPADLTFADEKRLATLMIAKKYFSAKDVSNEKRFSAALKKNAGILESFRKQFDYVESNYAFVKHVGKDDIVQDIRSYLTDTNILADELERLKGYPTRNRENIRNVLRKHSLKENPLWFFSELTYWREHRKKSNLMGIHVLDMILVEVEKCTGIRKNLLQFLGFDEIRNVLRGLIPEAVLEKRRRNGILVSVAESGYRQYEDLEAESVRNDLESLLPGLGTEMKILNGQTASQGYAKGIAHIVLTQDDFDTFQDGEILVTSMTRPEFVPLMRKASAVVTNEGGITCHAAIISRELRLPCVIGVRVATDVINSGDVIEVRANHGTVRILGK